MHPAAALLGNALWEFAKRNADEPKEQDSILDFLEDLVKESANKWDDKFLLPTFKGIRIVLDIEELPGTQFADESDYENVVAVIEETEQVIRPLRGPKSLAPKTPPESLS